MELPSASEIEKGRAILFLGAGFSAEATNISGNAIKDVTALTKQMLDACNIDDQKDYDLETAAQEFQDKFGDEQTITVLHDNFRSNITTKNQNTIVCQPWYRIYTTNYDDIVERICFEAKKNYTTKDISDDVEPPIRGVTQLLHIYGNVTKASPQEFRSNFLLTESQRDNSPFIKTPWFRRLFDDIQSASSIIFVGFSMSDIDLRRQIAQLPPSIRAKIHFVGRASTSRPTIRRLSGLGTFHGIETSGLATHLGSARTSGPITQELMLPAHVRELTFEHASSNSVSSVDIHFLLSVGILNSDLLAQSDINAEAGSYTISRAASNYERAQGASTLGRLIVVHGDIGNGKLFLSINLAISTRPQIIEFSSLSERASTMVSLYHFCNR